MKFYLFIIFVLCQLVLLCNATTKIWKYSQDIHDPKNWIFEDDPDDCEGLIFPGTTSGFTVLDKLNVKEIVLPENGDILLSDDADIEINADSTNKLNCVILNQTRYTALSWPDKSNWIVKDLDFNPAVPPQEILPCEHDDVIFPNIEVSTITLSYSDKKIKIKSLKIGEDMWTNDDLKSVGNSDDVTKIISGWSALDQMLEITGKDCTDPTGCVCGNANDPACWYWAYSWGEDHPCTDLVQPVGFCQEMCGAYILFRPKKTFRIDEFRKILKSYESYSYVSKIEKDMREYIQVIFTEKEFEGSSLTDAEDLHQRLLDEPNLGAKSVEIKSAKRKLHQTSAVGIVFATLFAVSTLFALLFLAYSPRYRELIRTTLEDRLNLPIRSSRATFTTQFMAKFRKDDDSGPFVDSQSMRGSVVSLEKAFENPLYGKSTPSTSSTTYDAKILPEVMNADGEMENPLFDEKRLEEIRNVGENGDLVDLSESSTNI